MAQELGPHVIPSHEALDRRARILDLGLSDNAVRADQFSLGGGQRHLDEAEDHSRNHGDPTKH
ncbi:MAG: hypothetical protein EXQ90_05835 [Rhodospirillales bacterium]|nr:hypothetical protein [Rhodospirillales bacterium]